jgi:hypothetical protein
LTNLQIRGIILKEAISVRSKLTDSERKDKKKQRDRQYRLKNREKSLAYKKKYKEEHPEKVAASVRRWKDKNPEKKAALNKKWAILNPEKASNSKKKYEEKSKDKRAARHRKKYANDPIFRLKSILRARLNSAIGRKQKSGSAIKQLGCTVEQLKVYLELQFTPGMTWENHGSYWEIDHKIPLAKVDLQDSTQLAMVCHYTNLQPLTKEENRKKRDLLPI